MVVTIFYQYGKYREVYLSLVYIFNGCHQVSEIVTKSPGGDSTLLNYSMRLTHRPPRASF